MNSIYIGNYPTFGQLAIYLEPYMLKPYILALWVRRPQKHRCRAQVYDSTMNGSIFMGVGILVYIDLRPFKKKVE